MARYPIEGVKVRFIDALRIAEGFLQVYNERYESDVRIDAAKLFVVARSAMDDVQRFKEYHLEGAPNEVRLSDAVKRAGYFTKWILRIRPLYEIVSHDNFLANPSGIFYRPTLAANEEFSIALSLFYLGEHVNLDLRFNADYLYDLMYNLLYRQITADGLMMLYNTICLFAIKTPPLI